MEIYASMIVSTKICKLIFRLTAVLHIHGIDVSTLYCLINGIRLNDKILFKGVNTYRYIQDMKNTICLLNINFREALLLEK